MSLGIFNVKSDGKVESNPGLYLQKELGIVLRGKQDSATIKAIANPSGFIADRSKKIKDFFEVDTAVPGSGKVTAFFKARLAEYNELGLPSEVARQMAERSTMKFYEDELALLDLEMPGYAQSFQTATVEHNATIAKNDIAGNDFDKKAYKKKLKKKLKAKYANQD